MTNAHGSTRHGVRLGLIGLTVLVAVGGATVAAVTAGATGGDQVPHLYVEPEQSAHGDRTERVDIPVEHRVPVSDGRSDVPVGYLDERELHTTDPDAVKAYCHVPLPVAGDDGTLVGYLFEGYGYVDKETARDPDFSIREARIERHGTDDLPATCFSTPEQEDREQARNR